MKPLKGASSQTTTCRKEYKIITNPSICEPYWDEGMHYYKKGFKWTKLFKWQVRMYKSWKHNRKTQYKQ